jgi:hypothetical protein
MHMKNQNAPKAPKAPKAAEAAAPRERAQELMQRLLLVREAVSAVTARHREELAPLIAAREETENALLALLDEVGDNIKIRGIGTAYRRLDTSATISDGQAFREYVIRNKEWSLTEWRANKTAVREYVMTHKTVPPGVNYTQSWAVGLRADTNGGSTDVSAD